MAGCIDCKFYERDSSNMMDNNREIKRKCKAGNTIEMNQWWMDNGTVKRENISDMNCHEYSDSTKSLMKMNELMEQMLKRL